MSADREPRQEGRKRSARRRMLATALVVVVVAVAIGSSAAAFTATTGSVNNSIASGSVAIGDNDAGAALLSLPDARPGYSDTGCIRVTYTGSLPSTVRLYATTTGALGQYFDLKVTRGSTSDPFRTCTNFSADATDYIGRGAGVVYDGTLEGFPAGYASGLVDPVAGSPESWISDEAHAYKVHVTLRASTPAAAQGLSASSTFVWEARNE